MPIYSYKCSECKQEFRKLASKRQKEVQCVCGSKANFVLPKSVTTTTFETKDKQRGKIVPKGLQGQLLERMRDHHDRYELAEKIDKQGMDEARRSGWTKKIKRS